MLKPRNSEYRKLLENRPTLGQNIKRYKSDAFLYNTRVCFQDLLRVLINVECRVEALRQMLNKQQGFKIQSLYEKIDKLNKGRITDIDVNITYNVIELFI